MQSPSFLSLMELVVLMRQGEITSEEIVSACLSRIRDLDGKLHAYVEVYDREALRLARRADELRIAGMASGPLHGLPLAIKDLLDLESYKTTAGSLQRRGPIARQTATSIQRLLSAGMIPLGKTHMVEFAYGSWGRNSAMGSPWNPWDANTHRIAGGSSSGSAVAVAAGMAPAAIGSDTGGSVRIPASACGVSGLKPTYGRVSLHGCASLSSTLDTVGPLGRSAEDLALMLEAMSSSDPLDAAVPRHEEFRSSEVIEHNGDLRGMRIALISRRFVDEHSTLDVAQAYEAATAELRGLGADIDEEDVPWDWSELTAQAGIIIAAEAYAAHHALAEDFSAVLDEGVRARLVQAKSVTASAYIAALRHMQDARAQFGRWMSRRDAIVSPTLPITATAHDEVDESTAPHAVFTRPVNYLGGCALSVPCGLSAGGLPIGLQLIGAPFGEARILQIGKAYQERTNWHTRAPLL